MSKLHQMKRNVLETNMSQSSQNEQSNETDSMLLDDDVILDSSSYFPIRELSLKTGVNSVTLRAWERRYGLLKPKRTNKGHRLYDQDDVLQVEGILRWIQQGVAVSKVRALLEQGATLDVNVTPSNEWLEWQESLVKASENYQEAKIEQLYQQIFSQYPADIAVRDWLLPSFEKLGKGAPLVFCESVLLSCLIVRVSSLKLQQKASQKKQTCKILITSTSSQKTLWCYIAAVLLLDKGLPCRVISNAMHTNDWSELVKGTQAPSILIFAENEVSSKLSGLIDDMVQWQKPVAVIGAGFWLAAYELGLTNQGFVKVYSEALEGVMDFMKTVKQ
jgi:DNA-binding transcriptional MerR regulator